MSEVSVQEEGREPFFALIDSKYLKSQLCPFTDPCFGLLPLYIIYNKVDL